MSTDDFRAVQTAQAAAFHELEEHRRSLSNLGPFVQRGVLMDLGEDIVDAAHRLIIATNQVNELLLAG